MNSTLSELYSSCYTSLTMPTDEILSRIELSAIVLRRLTFRLEQVRQSEQGVQLSTTPVEFTMAANDNEVILTDLVSDFVIPMWAEYQTWDFLSNPVWNFLPTVNLSMLQEQRGQWKYACSFYGSSASDVRLQTSLYGNEATIVNPYAANIRVFYCQDIPLPTSEDGVISLPNNLVQMVLFDSLVSAIPLMQSNAAKYVNDRPHLAPQIASWNGLLNQYKEEKGEFEVVFHKWCTESRGAHRPSMAGDVLRNVIGSAGGSTPFWINNPPN